MIIFGNGLGALLGSLSLQGKAAHPYLLVIAMWIFLLPVCTSYLKLRGMPRPASVSRRRIGRLTAYSGLLGGVWAAAIVFYLPDSPFDTLAFAFMGCSFLAAGAAAAIYVIPMATAAYATPIFMASTYVAATGLHTGQLWLTLLILLMACGVAWGTMANWEGFRLMTKISVERVKLLSDAQAAIVSRNQFLENVSHEIRTPLTTMLGYTKLLKAQEAQMLVTHREALGYLDTSCFSLLTTIDALLDVAKLNADQLSLQDAVFDPRKLIQEVLESVRFRAQEKNIALGSAYGADVPAKIYGDPERVRQIVVNLLGNAIKFTNTGRVDVELRCETGTQDRSNSYRGAMQPAEPMLCILVRDTGIGIEAAKKALVFNNFYQVDGSSRRLHGGMGLGLTVSNLLTRLMNGSLDFESDGVSGSSFKCMLPLRPHVGRTVEPAFEESTDIAAWQVLVVDDDPYIRHYLMTLLSTEGWKVHLAESGEHAIDECSRQRFDLILMDIQMPVMTGIDASVAVWTEGSMNEHTPIVAVTGYLSTDRIAEMREAGLVEYLSKPIVQEQLLAKARQCAARGSKHPATAVFG
ncbi:response regulator [Variovorax sp. RHLX14]|uniref:response regulator n=1 Tax=Variovorax sp. RHLX14 TaxID=1259731 RepID=UPI003F485410